jgi:hypothetical protein
MALLCDYFIAPGDEAAAATIDWVGGPSKPPEGRGLIRRRQSSSPYPTLPLAGIEPTTMMGKLEELLTGRSFDEILADPSGHQVAIRDGGERIVWALTDNLQNALSNADAARLREVAAPWTAPDDFYGPIDADAARASEALLALAALVRAGKQEGQRLYCWMCV